MSNYPQKGHTKYSLSLLKYNLMLVDQKSLCEIYDKK